MSSSPSALPQEGHHNARKKWFEAQADLNGAELPLILIRDILGPPSNAAAPHPSGSHMLMADSMTTVWHENKVTKLISTTKRSFLTS